MKRMLNCRSDQDIPDEAHLPKLRGFDVHEITVAELQAHYAANHFSAFDYTAFCLDRIRVLNPYLEAVIDTNPDALSIAQRCDTDRVTGATLGRLNGVPVLVKDNIATKGPMHTTAGSWALLGSVVAKDAFVVQRLREEGAIVLGHCNMSEWASVRSKAYSTGYSPRGGQVRNPFDLRKTPFGSSSGSAVAVSANIVPLALGTETDTSIIGPATINGVVGIKPTVGLTSRSGVIPISENMDSVGTFGRTVADAVLCLDAIAAADQDDSLTLVPNLVRDIPYSDYLADRHVLEGARFGLPMHLCWNTCPSDCKSVASKVLEAIQQAGSTIVEVDFPSIQERVDADGNWNWEHGKPGESEWTVARIDAYNGLNRYFTSLTKSAIRSVEELVAYNKENDGTEGALPGTVPAFPNGQDNLIEVMKSKGLRDRKEQEVDELAVRYKQASGRERDTWKQAYSKAKTWFSLDDEEYKRLKANRDLLLRQCLENYLLSMQACDDFSKDVLRLVSLWLGNTIIADANESVRNHLESVPTMKLAPFVNQLSSRLMDSQDAEGFQRVLHRLLFRICVDHPFHSLYQLFAVSKSKGAKGDTIAESRHAAATKIAEKVQRSGNKSSSSIWIAIHNSNIGFVQFAQDKPRDDLKSGTKHEVRRFQYGRKLLDVVQGQKKSRPIPPPTMKIAIRPDKEYGSIPTMDVMEPHITIAGGVSAPKIATIIATDGSRHKMLLKGGNDDLRQDAIMEQVFEQVSTLLRDHRPTRQRNIEIRTYKVVPLTHNAGVIEFVQNTIPLHEYLLPAHQRYYPKDLKPNAARRAISDVQAKSTKDRVKTYLHVCTQFHPVMRFFYMEHFLDPDEWFQKRLNYSRSSAAISILGHVLGLGDRHGHNILLDEKTGEVVHIDLGVAFEAGRVLPVPELIPFRLTRDLVDGMGLSGVEGPFRRCCNFTLEALRKDQDVIMTILDVLRWDPLYSWSVSPLRVKRMQDQKEREDAAAKAAGRSETTSEMGVGDGADARSRRGTPLEQDGLAAAAAGGGGLNRADEPGEADRALATVAKKLSKSLSVKATVNELIRQATDEENLALLYCGWAAYA